MRGTRLILVVFLLVVFLPRIPYPSSIRARALLCIIPYAHSPGKEVFDSPCCNNMTCRSSFKPQPPESAPLKSPSGRSATRTGDPRLSRIFAWGTLRQKLPKPNRMILGIWENTLSNRPATKKCPAGLPGAQTRQKIARPSTHRPAAICDVFRGNNNKAPPKNMHDYYRRHEAASFEFFHERPGPDLEREEKERLGRVAHSPPR